MNKISFTSLLLILALGACTQSLAEETPQPPSATETPTLFIGSPLPTLETPKAGETAVFVPLPSFTPLSQPFSNDTVSALYVVINVFPDDMLNIRSGPGVENTVVGTLPYNQSGLTRTGKTSSVGEETWVEIQNPSGGIGWVNADFLTETVNPVTFCADARVATLILNLEKAVNTQDGELLRTLVSPAHGLDVLQSRYGNPANYSPEEAGWVFQSTYKVNWGPTFGNSESVVGTFEEIILPILQDTFKNEILTCNEVKLGGATYEVEWPEEYTNLNFYSIHSPGVDPAYDGLDWHTWLAGIEYVDGQPYLFSLTNYQWEP